MIENSMRPPTEARRRGLLIVWGAQGFSLVLLFILMRVVRPEVSADGNHALAWALGAVGFMTFLLSFLMKRKLLTRAAAEQRLDVATTAYVVAFVMCEATAILGFVAHIITGLSYAKHSFIIAAVGLLMHFPTRAALEEVAAAGGATAGADFKSTL